MWTPFLGTEIPNAQVSTKAGQFQLQFHGDWASVACGSDFGLALTREGSLWAWGNRHPGGGSMANSESAAETVGPNSEPVRQTAREATTPASASGAQRATCPSGAASPFTTICSGTMVL